ncbi:DMT family transporter [Pelagibacterium xiamenense]|uniref:DMT family transporter n=1 Tax=Pelagibacterium xiamenense TaxID=2901140 RepID=UPI001E406F95|nr:DMT family transporter [Pelagibacterium xiamenense]MCD7059716.1 DMT family transporter [Pelagibacterium xiamenense]
MSAGTVQMPGQGRLMLAAALMAGAAILSAADAAIVRLLAGGVHPFVIGFFRGFFGLLFVLPWIASRPGMLRSHYRFMHVARAGLKLLSLICFFIAFGAAPLADATAIVFTGPIFLTLGAWLLLGERLGAARVFAVIAGFSGAMIVLQPGNSEGVSPALLFALAGAALTAVVQLMLKVMSARDNTDTLVAWNLILIVPLALIPAIAVWTTPTLFELGLLVAQGIFGALNMTFVTRALGMADASFLAPLDFLRLPAVAIFAFILFGEIAGPLTWIGAAVIFGATLIAAGGGWLARLRVRLWPF